MSKTFSLRLVQEIAPKQEISLNPTKKNTKKTTLVPFLIAIKLQIISLFPFYRNSSFSFFRLTMNTERKADLYMTHTRVALDVVEGYVRVCERQKKAEIICLFQEILPRRRQ